MSSNCKIDGFDELISKLNSLGQVGNTIGNRALKEAGKVIVEQQKKDAPKNTGEGAKALKVGKVKTSKIKNKYVQIGITKETDWNAVQGVYFQHYGYKNHMTGRYHAGSLWMDKSFEKAKGKASSVLVDRLSKELKF